ncbi:electron transfer flavoprotein subunit beta/FixA family protein [Lacrimispora sp. NSJ-141]|uniref:Electron transfer flavoprotein small subunit n=1 Tax=Lientehia hominis TaxID=2897778 RepID=A0AAP2RII7_9FIRM|nr:electron transfer flavoprotein subunit beta/FixA family protein [Lientehia hominis]MCD2491490.1 electron transfer flavoprotein subunit beta/FixA family protein [Lientehia hominis]
MKIVVCIKQVPAASNVEIDPESGTLKRAGSESKTNPYDLFALEAALRLREKLGGTVTALTMGPPQAEEMMRDAYSMGIDHAVILSDKKFAGSDVLATSYTLSQGITALGEFDLILCGKQTTDGDTAQIGPALAEHLHLPHTAWAGEICEASDTYIRVRQKLSAVTQVSEMNYPCVITVDKDLVVPRLPSWKLKKAAEGRPVRFMTFQDLPDQDMTRYGLIGSPTTVERIFPPEKSASRIYVDGTPEEKAGKLYEVLKKAKFLQAGGK